MLIYDVNSGQLAAKFETEEEKGRNGLVAAENGRAVFSGDAVIVSTRRLPGTFFRPTLRVFDSKTGKTVRVISAEGTGVRDPIAISADGRVLLGFVWRVRKAMLWSDLTSYDVPVNVRIRLWEMPSPKCLLPRKIYLSVLTQSLSSA